MPVFIFPPPNGNPIVRIIVSILFFAGLASLFFFSLPIIFAIILGFLLIGLGIVAYAWIYRKIHGDPLEEMLKQMREQQGGTQRATEQKEFSRQTQGAKQTSKKQWKMTEVEDVEEVKKPKN